MPETQIEPGRAKRKPLNPRQLAVIDVYTRPGATLGKAKATGLEVFPHMTPDSARVTVHEILKNPDVREAVEAAVLKHGAGIGWRIQTLRDLADPETILTEVKESTKTVTLKGLDDEAIVPADEITQTVTKRAPAPSDVVRAIDVLNKMDGTYSFQSASANLSARYQTLTHRFRTVLANTLTNSEESVASLDKPQNVARAHGPKRGLCVPGGLPIYQTAYLGSLPDCPPDAAGEATVNAASVGSEQQAVAQ